MAERVDAPDLKSGGPKGPCGFESHSQYYMMRNKFFSSFFI